MKVTYTISRETAKQLSDLILLALAHNQMKKSFAIIMTEDSVEISSCTEDYEDET